MIIEVQRAAGAVALQRHELHTDGWSCETLSNSYSDLWAAVAGVPELHEIGGGVISQIFVNDESDARRLVERFVVREPAEPETWSPEVAQAWQDEDEQLEEEFPGVNWLPVWARVSWLTMTPQEESSYRVTALEIQAGPDTHRFAVLVDDEPSIVGTETLAKSSWFSESGGAPISWNGGNRLVRLSGNVVADFQWGDLGQEFGVSTVSKSDSVADTIAAWVQMHDLEAVAAVHLEPLDPDETLGAGERAAWEDLLNAVRDQTSFEVEDKTADEVRARLMSAPRYAEVARALAKPDGDEAQVLRATLKDVANSGALGSFVTGEFEAEPDEWEDDEE